MPVFKPPRIQPSEITAERFFHMRRELLAGALGLAAAAALPATGAEAVVAAPAATLRYTRNPPLRGDGQAQYPRGHQQL